MRNLTRLLAAIREHTDLTQRDLAMRIPVTRNTMLRWETGKLPPTTRRLILWVIHLGATFAIVDQDGRIHHTYPADPRNAAHCARQIYGRMAAILGAQRVRLGIRQSDVAAAVGARAKFRHWEEQRRHPTLKHLLAWCREVGCKIVIELPADHPAALARRPEPPDLSLAA